MNLNKTCALENLAQLIICVGELMHHSKVFLNSLIAARPGSIFTAAGLMPGEAPLTGQGRSHKTPEYSNLCPLNNPWKIAPSSFIQEVTAKNNHEHFLAYTDHKGHFALRHWKGWYEFYFTWIVWLSFEMLLLVTGHFLFVGYEANCVKCSSGLWIVPLLTPINI